MTVRTVAWLGLTAVLATGTAAVSRMVRPAGLASVQAQTQKSVPKPPRQQPPLPTDDDKPEVTVFLIGDAGAPAQDHEPVLTALQKLASDDPRRTVVMFLGDNIYPDGMPDSSSGFRKEAERRLDAQLDVIRSSKARGIFISGNHDWGGITGRDGWNAIRREGAYIAAKGAGSSMMPEAGCPGPAVQDVGTNLRLVMLDTQWWLRRQGPPSKMKDVVPCAFVSQNSVIDSLKKVLTDTDGRRVVLMSHHPLASQGSHGGYFSNESRVFPLTNLKSWLRIPLPMVGSVFVAARRLGMSEQDLASPPYSRMIRNLMSAFTENEPLIYAAGHDHDMQVMQFGGSPQFMLVSGSGIYGHVSGVGTGGPAKYAKAESGFMRLRSWADGRLHLTVYTVDHSAKATEAFNQWVIEQGATRPADPKHAD